MEPIVVDFTPTEKDYLRAFRLFNNRKVNYYVKQVIYFLIGLIMVTALFAWKGSLDESIIWLPYALMLLAFFAYLNLNTQQTKQNVRKNQQLTLPIRLELDEQKVTVKNELITTDYGWPNFREVYDDTEYFYLVHAHDPKAYLFIPKRSFDSDQKIEAFRTFAQQHIRTTPKRK